MELKPLKLKFFLKKARNRTDKYIVFMSLSLSGERTEISLSYLCDRNEWNETTQSLKHRHPDYSYVLNLTNGFRQRALEIFQHYLQRGMPCRVYDIKQRLIKKADAFVSVNPTLIELFERNSSRRKALSGKNNTLNTISKYDRCKVHLQNFMKANFGKSDIDCNKIDLRFIEDFEIHLKTTAECSHNTTMKYMQNFKTVYKSALAYGYAHKDYG